MKIINTRYSNSFVSFRLLGLIKLKMPSVVSELANKLDLVLGWVCFMSKKPCQAAA